MSDISGSFTRPEVSGDSVFFDEQTTNDASNNTSDVYRTGALAVGDFSSTPVTASGFHYKGDGTNAVILEGDLNTPSPELVLINPDNSGDCVQTTITNRDGSRFTLETSTGVDFYRVDCDGTHNFIGGDVSIQNASGEVMRFSQSGNIATDPDILFDAQGLIAAESNLLFKSESGEIGFYFGGPGSGTSGATERAFLNSSGDFHIDRYFSQGTEANTFPSDTCTFSGLSGNYFNSNTYFSASTIHNLGLWVPYTSSAGGSGMWGVIPNDGIGNWHMYWNTTDGTPGPNRCANGIAFEWEVNDFQAGDSLVLKSAAYGAAGSTIAWLNAISVRPSITATGAVGIKRVPTTYDFEVNGRAAKTVPGNWITISDRRLKSNIQNFSLGLDAINSLQPRTFTLNEDDSQEIQVGWVAQEIQGTPFEPFAVGTWTRETTRELPPQSQGQDPTVEIIKKEYLSLDDSSIVPALVNAIKELTDRIEQLESAQTNPKPNNR